MQKYILSLIVLFLLLSCGLNNNKTVINNLNNEIDSKIDIGTGVVEKQNTSSGLIDSNSTSTSSGVISEDVLETIIKEGKYCILDECIPDDVNVKEENGFYLGNIDKKGEYEEDTKKYTYKLSKNLDYFEIILDEMMHKETKKIFKVGEVYVKSIDNSGCGGSNIDQKVYDKNGNEIKDYILNDIKKNIFVGNIIYKQTLTGSGGFGQPLDSFNKFKFYGNFENEQDFVDYISDDYKNIGKRIFKSYIVQFKKYPGINIIYNSEYDDKSIRVVYLGTDNSYLSKNIDINGNLIDLTLTNKIIGYYNGDNVSYGLFDTSGNRITEVDSKKIPIFKMEKLNNEGNYLVYLNNGYELQPFAEMCKPVVYYYSKDNEANSLTLNTKKGDYFTKIIPDFTSNNTWEFISNNSKIEVDGKKYDYLYYSLLTTGYKHNNDGWIVKGNDIVDFFEDKLVKINFNKVEKKDFIDYWKNEYKNDKYYFISFKYKEELDKIIKLDFSRGIENEFRVLLDSYEIDYIDQKHKKYLYDKSNPDKFDRFLIQRFNRKYLKNEVFEWGGVLVKGDEIIIK